ncbi:hypothetical protein C8R46DRAFT_1207333 [Mycena filopes]|nr:hypothetical protein C8R46DRAFT_1207333 [Mycena filopes]
MRFLSLFLTVFTLAVNAVVTNHTVDDSALLLGLDDREKQSLCPGCVSPGQMAFDVTRLFNRTATTLEANGVGAVSLTFTGTAVYICIAIPVIGTLYRHSENALDTILYVGPGSPGIITLDGEEFKDNPTFPILNNDPQYSYCSWFTTGLTDGPHSLKLETDKTPLVLDSIVYTSNDPDPSSSDTSIATSSTSDTTTTTSSGSTASLASHKKAPVGAIAGGVVGGTALILAFLVGWMLSRRAKRRRGPTTPAMEESASPQDHSPLTRSSSVAILTKNDPPSQDAVAERFRLLEEQIRQLSQQRAGSSTAGSSVARSDTASLGRSLSTMKREQTRALVEHGERGDGVTDTLVHTDSGLRLTAGRTADELPPTYVAD